jgi:hypothetical protein
MFGKPALQWQLYLDAVSLRLTLQTPVERMSSLRRKFGSRSPGVAIASCRAVLFMKYDLEHDTL